MIAYSGANFLQTLSQDNSTKCDNGKKAFVTYCDKQIYLVSRGGLGFIPGKTFVVLIKIGVLCR
jgi:hypothetical protein